MPSKLRCIVCEEVVEPYIVKVEFKELFEQADAIGMDSLTEHEQIVVEFKCCSEVCFYKMN